MEKTRLGRTNLWVSRTAFGALPIQRVDFETAKVILRQAYAGGITFFDTARGYSDSEKKLGYALSDVRKDIVISTKSSGASDKTSLLERLDISLNKLKTDYVDLLQLHNPATLPDPDDPNSLYAGLLEAQQQGKTHFIGITNHKLDNALQAARSGLYDTVQFPLSAISADQDLGLIDVCRENDVGLIAMKALCGGLITNAKLAFTALRQYENVVPIWGIQRESELAEFLSLEAAPPPLDGAMRLAIAQEKAELAGDFCRGCGYCLPCPVEIPIPMAARMSFLLRRSPSERWLTPEWQEQMHRIDDCLECRQCAERCPYGLDTPALLKKMLVDYDAFLQASRT
jgi:aryl-alcohol dehydrogenase-like predicted oxidoreductase/Pyruvate/2-oxoacid:ferredoxin oxidoreductase delta subunit